MSTTQETVITSYANAPSRTIAAEGVTYAYRELGPKGGVPVVFFVHLAATLDNWDPRIVDPIAANRHVIAFDNRGVGASSGDVPDSIEAMADDAYTFIRALGFDTIDIFSFSLGGMVAQALVVKHPELVRKLVLTGTGPKGGSGIDKVAGTTYWDMLRAALTLSDPKEFLFFNRNAAGIRAAAVEAGLCEVAVVGSARAVRRSDTQRCTRAASIAARSAATTMSCAAPAPWPPARPPKTIEPVAPSSSGIATIIVASTGSSPRDEPCHCARLWNSTGSAAM